MQEVHHQEIDNWQHPLLASEFYDPFLVFVINEDHNEIKHAWKFSSLSLFPFEILVSWGLMPIMKIEVLSCSGTVIGMGARMQV
jgi:hypothetical protein